MMSWLTQFSLVMRSSVTALREQIEDPERMLHQLLIDMQAELDTVRASVAEAVADEILMRKRINRERDEELKWQERAAGAVKRGDEDTARTALDQKLACSKRVQQYTTEHTKQVVEVEKLKTAVRDLEDKIRQAQHKKSLLVARLARAKSTTKIQAAIERTDQRSAFSQFQRLEDRVDRQEARIQAWSELDQTDVPTSDLEKEFLEKERKEQVELELEALRKSLN